MPDLGPIAGSNEKTSRAIHLLSAIVYIVDDDASFRAAVQRRLQTAGYRVVTYASAEEVLQQPPDESGSGCILLDVRMPGLSGPALHSQLVELGSTLPIVYLSGYADVSATVQAIKAGAEDFLIKPASSDDLLRAIKRALARHRTARESRRERDGLRGRLERLTPRERQVFALVVQGRTSKEAARELGTSPRTIKEHRRRVMEKMQAQTVAELASIAARLGRFTA